jgi:hypothetical protein
VRTKAQANSVWKLRADLASARALLWVAGAGSRGEPTPEVHLYLYDRYWRLAQHHEHAGHARRAAALRRKAELHYAQSGHDGPPYAAALALPSTRPSVLTSAIGRPAERRARRAR